MKKEGNTFGWANLFQKIHEGINTILSDCCFHVPTITCNERQDLGITLMLNLLV